MDNQKLDLEFNQNLLDSLELAEFELLTKTVK